MSQTQHPASGTVRMVDEVAVVTQRIKRLSTSCLQTSILHIGFHFNHLVNVSWSVRFYQALGNGEAENAVRILSAWARAV